MVVCCGLVYEVGMRNTPGVGTVVVGLARNDVLAEFSLDWLLESPASSVLCHLVRCIAKCRIVRRTGRS
jgi:hypothetical protein